MSDKRLLSSRTKQWTEGPTRQGQSFWHSELHRVQKNARLFQLSFLWSLSVLLQRKGKSFMRSSRDRFWCYAPSAHRGNKTQLSSDGPLLHVCSSWSLAAREAFEQGEMQEPADERFRRRREQFPLHKPFEETRPAFQQCRARVFAR